MKHLILMCVFVCSSAFAELDSKVLVKGKITSEFNDKQVKVTDSMGQIYFLPRRVFPSDYKFKEGRDFNLEIDSRDMVGIKPLKK